MASRRFRIAAALIRRLPFYLLALKGVWLTLYFFGIHVGDYWFISELQAHSVAFCFVLAFYAYVNRSCLYLWACILSLLGLNVLNIMYYFVNYPYVNYYSAVIIAAGLSFAFIHAATKPKRRSASR